MTVAEEISGAVISDCSKYRYQLWRIWDATKPVVMFIMLNPSTADSEIDDPTIRKCMAYAKSWGYGGMYVGNLYAYRATDPNVLDSVEDANGVDNLKHLKQMASKCEKIVCAWGNSKAQPEYIFSNFNNLHYLKLNQDTTPAHPLYLSKDLKPTKF